MTRISIVLAAAIAITACGPDEFNANTNAKTEDVPITPLGRVTGLVLDLDERPLSDVAVRLILGSEAKTTTTNEDGEFTFADVPAGSEHIVTLSKEGFATVRTHAFVPASAGSAPLADGAARLGPVLLAELNSTAEFVVLQSERRPAVGATASLALNLAGLNDWNDVVSSVRAVATVGSSGKLVFTGLPDARLLARRSNYFSYQLWIDPYDADNDGIPEFEGYTRGYGPSEIVASSSSSPIALTPIYTHGQPLRVSGTNVRSLAGTSGAAENFLTPGEDIVVTFNEPIVPASVVARLADETASTELTVTTAVSDKTRLTITPPTLSEGARYNVFVRAVSTAGQTFEARGYFFVGKKAAPVPLAIKKIWYQETTVGGRTLDPGEEVWIEFNQPIKWPNAASSVHAYLEANVGATPGIGNDAGEEGFEGNGFPLEARELVAPYPTERPARQPVFSISSSGYTSFYGFRYTGTQTIDMPATLALSLDFDKLRERTTAVYETIWSAPVKGRFSDNVTLRDAIP